MARLLAIVGSGETAPTMVKPHRDLFRRLRTEKSNGTGRVSSLILDTPYGFQVNADDISARAVDYFRASVGEAVEPAHLRRADPDDPVRLHASLAKLAAADWVFAGPGSPTYALRHWSVTEVPNLLEDKLSLGGCVVFASAAALTLGAYTVPVYEIYKCGSDPAWVPGLDLLSPHLGSGVAVIPHFDNAEGGNHDTRYCYLGEERLRMMERQLPPDGWVLGVDEHTACILDLEASSAAVVGNGRVTVRSAGRAAVLEAGESLALSQLRMLASERTANLAHESPVGQAEVTRARTALHGEIRTLEESFDTAMANRDVDGLVRAILDLDRTLDEWGGDTTQSDAADRGRAAWRRMVVRLGELAEIGARDPRQTVAGLVDALLEQRASARSSGRYADADRVREVLVSEGIAVQDTPEGTTWDITTPPPQRPAGAK